MPSIQNIKLAWNTEFSELAELLKNQENKLLFIKLLTFRQNIDRNEMHLIRTIICPAAAQLENDNVIWHINDEDPVSDSLIIKNNATFLKRKDILGYMVYNEGDIPDETSDKNNAKYTYIHVITSFCTADIPLPKKRTDITLEYEDGRTEEFHVNLQQPETTKLIKTINAISDIIYDDAGLGLLAFSEKQ